MLDLWFLFHQWKKKGGKKSRALSAGWLKKLMRKYIKTVNNNQGSSKVKSYE